MEEPVAYNFTHGEKDAETDVTVKNVNLDASGVIAAYYLAFKGLGVVEPPSPQPEIIKPKPKLATAAKVAKRNVFLLVMFSNKSLSRKTFESL